MSLIDTVRSGTFQMHVGIHLLTNICYLRGIAFQLCVRLDVVLGAEVHDLLGVCQAARRCASDGGHAKDEGNLVNLES